MIMRKRPCFFMKQALDLSHVYRRINYNCGHRNKRCVSFFCSKVEGARGVTVETPYWRQRLKYMEVTMPQANFLCWLLERTKECAILYRTRGHAWVCRWIKNLKRRDDIHFSTTSHSIVFNYGTLMMNKPVRKDGTQLQNDSAIMLPQWQLQLYDFVEEDFFWTWICQKM